MNGAVEIRIDLRAVVYFDREVGRWIGHCLELDLVGEGNSPSDATREVMELCDTHIDSCIESGDLDGIFSPAPSEIERMYAEAVDFDSDVKRPSNTEVVRVRQYGHAA